MKKFDDPKIQALVNALGVMVLTPHILLYLQENDPMALLQAKDALKDMGVDPEPEFVFEEDHEE